MQWREWWGVQVEPQCDWVLWASTPSVGLQYGLLIWIVTLRRRQRSLSFLESLLNHLSLPLSRESESCQTTVNTRDSEELQAAQTRAVLMKETCVLAPIPSLCLHPRLSWSSTVFNITEQVITINSTCFFQILRMDLRQLPKVLDSS